MATAKKAYIDSINLRGDALTLFSIHRDFEVTQLLNTDKTIKDTKAYKDITGCFFNKNQKEVYKVTHSSTLQSFIIQSYHNSYDTFWLDGDRTKIYDYTITFAGLHGYNQRSKNLLEILLSLSENLLGYMITRIDVATDTKIKPTRLLNKLDADKSRYKVQYKNTTYYNQRSRNVTIAYYNKGLKEKLSQKTHRVEYRFRGSYLTKKFYWTHEGLTALYKRLEGYVFKAFNEKIKVQKIVPVSSLCMY